MKASRTGIVLASLPGLLALGLFHSLALHMHRTLGGWPSGIGTAGFPPALVTHANIAQGFFWMTIGASLCALPVAVLVCLIVSRWQHFIPYFGLYVFVFVLCIILMQFAPEPYLYWWND
jgi:hypothetical protein